MSVLGPASHIITHRVRAPGSGLHVIDQPGTGPPVVLLHGFPDDSRIYHRLMPQLAPHRAVAFDFLGYGHSDRAEGRPDPGSMRRSWWRSSITSGPARRSWRPTTPADRSRSIISRRGRR